MQMRAQLLSGATSVAHLIGISGRTPRAGRPHQAAAPPADTTEQGGEGEEEAGEGTQQPPAPPAPEPASEPVAGAPAAAPAAAQPAAEDDGEDDNDEKDDDDKEMSGAGKKAQARRRERARCRAILTSDAAQRNPAIAMQLALNTSMPRQQVLAMLEAMPQGAGGLDARMASVPNPRLGANTGGAQPGQPDGRAIASSWEAAFAKVPGKRFAAATAAKDTAASWDAAFSRVA